MQMQRRLHLLHRLHSARVADIELELVAGLRIDAVDL